MRPTDYHYLQFFNIVLRTCLEKLKLQLLGRNYYDPNAAKKLKEFKLELWPGYETSIKQHEADVLLCCEISTKVLRLDTGNLSHLVLIAVYRVLMALMWFLQFWTNSRNASEKIETTFRILPPRCC